ncbi:MAG: murein hydrolase activator EnvC family protein [Clostridia bacterium]|jgi:murein DD-endopeptidase MepM/ murein hydrolase activator NlpD|nr:putative uncharacterized protein [Clostridium sp. CAG:798]HBJ12249.1 hypothetical protein [Clostridiales bacterium]
MKETLRKILIIISILILCTTLSTGSIATDISDLDKQKKEVSEELNKKNKQLEYVNEELTTALLEIQKLDDEILQYETDLNKYETQLSKLQTSIDEAIEKIDLVQEDYQTREEILRERLVEMYKAGDVTYLEVLLSSKSLTEFISSYFLMRQLVEYDNKLIEQVEREKNDLEYTKAKLEKEQKEVKTIKAKKEQTTIILNNKKTLQKAHVNKLSEEEKKLQKEIIEYKKEVYRIQSLISQVSGEPNLQIQYTGGDMIWPVAKEGTAITSYYEQREHPITGIIHYHSGIDIGNAYFGTPVVAALDGYVSYAGWLGGYGNCVIINHGNGVSTLYGHGQAILTTLHKEVKQGELIMEVGSTGNSTGPHLHFEIRINGYTVNPLLYVNEPTE